MKLLVLGAGAWGTALAVALARQHQVCLWGRDAVLMATMQQQRQNPQYLPEAHLPSTLFCTADWSEALGQVPSSPAAAPDLVLVVTPVLALRPTLQVLAQRLPTPVPVLWACKGFEADTSLLPHQVAQQCLPDHQSGVLTGPSFAREVVQGLPTALTLAASDPARSHWAAALSDGALRLYASPDVIGAEVGGAVKNVIAIASGLSDGLNLGHNARAALITRGLAEMTRLGLALGGQVETFLGLSGVGDLLLTATGDLSRNRQVGLRLAQGQTLDQILQGLGHVAEGVRTVDAVLQQAQRLQVDMPITQAVQHILRGQWSAQQALQALMQRSPKVEFAPPALP